MNLFIYLFIIIHFLFILLFRSGVYLIFNSTKDVLFFNAFVEKNILPCEISMFFYNNNNRVLKISKFCLFIAYLLCIFFKKIPVLILDALCIYRFFFKNIFCKCLRSSPPIIIL